MEEATQAVEETGAQEETTEAMGGVPATDEDTQGQEEQGTEEGAGDPGAEPEEEQQEEDGEPTPEPETAEEEPESAPQTEVARVYCAGPISDPVLYLDALECYERALMAGIGRSDWLPPPTRPVATPEVERAAMQFRDALREATGHIDAKLLNHGSNLFEAMAAQGEALKITINIDLSTITNGYQGKIKTAWPTGAKATLQDTFKVVNDPQGKLPLNEEEPIEDAAERPKPSAEQIDVGLCGSCVHAVINSPAGCNQEKDSIPVIDENTGAITGCDCYEETKPTVENLCDNCVHEPAECDANSPDSEVEAIVDTETGNTMECPDFVADPNITQPPPPEEPEEATSEQEPVDLSSLVVIPYPDHGLKTSLASQLTAILRENTILLQPTQSGHYEIALKDGRSLQFKRRGNDLVLMKPATKVKDFVKDFTKAGNRATP